MQNKIFVCTILFFVFYEGLNGQGTWTQKASLPDTARVDAMSFAVGNKGYITQGANASFNRLHSLWEYDATNNSWAQKQNFVGIARFQGVSFTISSKGYIATGQDMSSSLNNDLWEYDYLTDTWTQKASMPTTVGRNFAVGFSIGNKAYVGLGVGNGIYLNDFWEYDLALNSWIQKADFPPPYGRYGAVGLSIGTKGYVGIGMDHFGTRYDDFWEYDPATDTWTQKTNFPGGAREEMDGVHFTIGNYGYVGTGRSVISSSWVYYNDFWRYDPLNDSWTQMPSLPASPRIGASSFTINNIGYLGLGYNGAVFDDLWSFVPNTTSVNEINADNSITIFPNPFSSEATISLHKNLKNATLIIFNAAGQKEKNIENISGQTIKLYRDNLPVGLYFIQLTQENKVIAMDKLIISN